MSDLPPLNKVAELRNKIKQLEHELENTRTQSRWISVENEVPVVGQKFDAWHYSGRATDCGAYAGSGWDEKSIRKSMLINGLSHWMPLPAPPKVGE